jgi:hypothetical protein
VGCRASAHLPWRDDFHEGLWCCEGLLAWEHYKLFVIMTLGCDAGAFEADGAG